MESTLIWAVTLFLMALILLPYTIKFKRRQNEDLKRRREAEELGIIKPRAQFPFIDQALCIGCGTCVAACPEGDVLGIVYGKAVIINGMRCVGHGHCEDVCPVGALKVGLGDVSTREDIPVLDENYQTTVPGLYVTGELGGLSLIRNAIDQGRTAIEHIIDSGDRSEDPEVPDVLIVGAGPAGITAALTCLDNNLTFKLVDQQEPGGTILQYPRRKLVMTQPAEIPLYGVFEKSEYSKEQLLEIWQDIIRTNDIEVDIGHKIDSVVRTGKYFEVGSQLTSFQAKSVVLALGRRGTPRKLGVPGEDLKKVAYQLIDARSYNERNILVVGGGDSAVEAAIALARQKKNIVTISYRKPKFFRIKKKNEDRLNELIRSKKIAPLYNSHVQEIAEKSVKIDTEGGVVELPNDDVFILAGGIPPFKMMKEMGIRFGGEMKVIA